VLEGLRPEPTLYPGRSEGTCQAWSLWADRLVFLPVVAVVFAEIGHLVPPAFIEDRTKMMPGRDFSDIPKQAPHARAQLRGLFAILEAQLADGRPWLLGDAFSLADAACFHPLWFLRVAPGASELLEEFARLRAWRDRVDALGEGERSAMTPAEALAIAKESRPETVQGGGQRVSVVPDDYAFDPVAGELVTSTAHEIAVRRTDPALGEIVVHFPRIGFRVLDA
jgi:glutathione S-transferase